VPPRRRYNRESFLEQLRSAIRGAIDDAMEAATPRRRTPRTEPEPEPERQRRPRRRPPPPRERPPSRARQEPTREAHATQADYQQVYMEEMLRRPDKGMNIQLNWIKGLYGFSHAPKDTQLETWRAFLQFNRSGYQPFRRNDPRHPWWQTSGIPVRRFPWAEWRAMMKRLGSP
jgi:hypothetical protein